MLNKGPGRGTTCRNNATKIGDSADVPDVKTKDEYAGLYRVDPPPSFPSSRKKGEKRTRTAYGGTSGGGVRWKKGWPREGGFRRPAGMS